MVFVVIVVCSVIVVFVRDSTSAVRQARESLLSVKGAKLFNLLPDCIRNINTDHVDTFKTNLDAFLSEVPDQLTVPGHSRAAETNSLLHQIPMMLVS